MGSLRPRASDASVTVRRYPTVRSGTAFSAGSHAYHYYPPIRTDTS